MNELTLTWPAAFAIVGGLVAAFVGINTLLSNRRDSTALGDMGRKLSDHESRLGKLETTLDGKVEEKFKNLDSGVARVEGKLDTLVSEVVTALAAIAGQLHKD